MTENIYPPKPPMENPTVQPSIPVTPAPATLVVKPKHNVLHILVFILFICSLLINTLQFFGFSFGNLKNPMSQNLKISPNNPGLIRYGLTYYLQGQINEVKNTGTNMEIITDIPDLPKLYIDKRTNILAKNGDKYDTISKDQIRPGRKVNLLLFNTSMKDWFLARIVLLP